ncbi:MAG: DUF1801 domain-containing protein [Thermoplasmata archaeon]|nr:DUF1801 domain-containing protein [Thermoplasmata archaeon]
MRRLAARAVRIPREGTARGKGSPNSGPTDSIPAVLEAVGAAVDRNCPQLHLKESWGQPWRAGTDLVVCFAAFTHHVGVEFWRGSTVPDPDGLLEGTGKNLRHVKVRSVAEARTNEFAALLRAAVLLDEREPKRTR